MILIADDDRDTLMLLGGMLEAAGLKYVHAEGGLQAVAVAKRVLPELVILDVQMPDIDGFEAFRRIRGLPGMGDVPILFLSAKGDDDRIVEGLELGANDFLVKPFKPVTLVARIRSTLSRYRQRPQATYHTFKVGAVIQRQYRVVEQIGRGGMAAVYAVEDISDRQPYALKVLHGVGMQADDAVERFKSEIRALWAIDHPNIVQMHDSFTGPDLCFFTMDYIDGPTLDDRLDEGEEISVEEALFIIERMADALSVAHDASILHRDLKPPNILFDADWEPILSDFGLVFDVEVEAERITHNSVLMGTPRYMSPEQVHSPRDLDARSDIYQLGVVFYEMLTGKTPFWDRDEFQNMFCTSELEVPSPVELVPTLPRGAVEVCMKALRNKRDDRFQSAREMADAATAALESLEPVDGL